jgi:hypothetical protein
MKWFARFVLAMVSVIAASPVYASSDSTCYPAWKIKQTDLDGCSSTALMSPGNDTRVNLLMLLYDRHGSVGVSHIPSYDSYADGLRRGEAQPFDYPVFANTLGPAKTKEDEHEDNSAAATRCFTNDAGSLAFMAALGKAKDIPASEAATLSAVRMMLKPLCTDGDQARVMVEQGVGLIKSKQGKVFASYLIGAAAFYDGDFAAARPAFASAAKAASPWLAGAANYMAGRVALNEAMAGAFDEYGSLTEKGADKKTLSDAEAGFLGYLKSYPEGEYAVSARGLLRKVYWLSGRKDKLLAEYIAQFAQKDASKRNVSLADMVQELDLKLLMEIDPAIVSEPVLLAVLDLKAMRHSDDPAEANADNPPITRAMLNAQRARFIGQAALYDYVLAAHSFYVANDPAETLRLIPAGPKDDDSYLGYSRKLLRALALEAQGDTSANAGARGALIGLITAAKHPFQRGSAELALAMQLERSKGLNLVFAAGSPIHDPDLREILLRYAAGPALLRSRMADKSATKRERDVALYALLYKSLTRGAYADFIRDSALIPADAKPPAESEYESPAYTNVSVFNWAGSKSFVCPSIRSVATALSTAPKDATALLCLGEFARTNDLDPGYYSVYHSLDETPDKSELGGTPSAFPGKPFSRGEIYKILIADPKVSATNKAYALYRAVNCYGPSGYNSCGGVDVEIGTRKAWFRRLKGEFASSPWAGKLDYYW